MSDVTLSKVQSTEVKEGKRTLKLIQYGAKTSLESSSFGDDSNPIKNLTALYANTGESGESVVIGYINTAQLEDLGIGEKRIYSTNDSGDVQFYIRLKNDGTCEINSDVDNAVRYSKLEEAFNELRDDFNDFVTNVYNLHKNPGNGLMPPDLQGTASTADITPSKIEEIKVP